MESVRGEEHICDFETGSLSAMVSTEAKLKLFVGEMVLIEEATTHSCLIKPGDVKVLLALIFPHAILSAKSLNINVFNDVSTACAYMYTFERSTSSLTSVI